MVASEMTAEVLAVPIDEAARRLSLSPRTVATLVATRQLRSVKIGRGRLIPVNSLRAFLRRDHAFKATSK